MAESNTLKRVLHDNDPFAELERIMGTGASAPVRDTVEPDPFQLDLERELLGEFADEPAVPQQVLRFRQPDDGVSEHHYSGQAQAPQWQREAVVAESEPEVHAAHAGSGEIDLAAEMDAIFAEEFDDQPLSGDAGAAQSFAPAEHAVQAEWQEDAAAFDVSDDELPLETADDQAAVHDLHPQEESLYASGETVEAAADGLADVDMDFGDLSAELEAASQDWYREQPAEAAFEEAAQPSTVEAQAVQIADEPALSLEDELVMLLSDSASARPYGRANYAPAAVNEWQAPAAFAEAAEAPAPDAAQPDLAAGEEAMDLGLEDELALDHEQFEPVRAEYMGPTEAEVATDAVFAAPAAEPVETAPADFDLDIVDVPGGQVAVEDDLDLPQLPVEEERGAAEPFGELEAEFAEMFRIREPEQADAGQAAGADENQELDDYYFNEALGAGATGLAYGRAAQPAYGATASADAYDDDSDGADMPAVVAASRGRPRRNMVIAGAVGALALLGIVGVFAFSGGDSGDAPALVRADEQPMKVRPENPGGATVPNQDSQAYQRAAGGAGDTVPAQKELVTTAEEPVNVAARAEAEAPRVQPEANAPATQAPSPSANALPGVNVGEKIEDRVPVEQEAAGTGLNEDLVAVTPRRVRTMVVRPDGTLVPREEVAAAPAPVQTAPQPAPAAQAPRTATPNAQPAAPAPAPRQAAPTPAPQQEAPQQQAAQPQPAPRQAAPAPQPAAPAPAPRQQQQVAAAPQAPRTQPEAPAAPAAASGEWSMQIASQPTAEGAQATYQDLARRYGDVLSGRGVNIVRADIQGKGTYYRVRIPSATRNDAIALCERYKAAGGSCFVSK